VYWIQLVQDTVYWWALVNGGELSGSLKGGKFLDHLSDHQLFKDFHPCI
jgi:hypothetical protein